MTSEQKPTQQTLQQKRAASAWQIIGQVPEAKHNEYVSLLRGLPALIQTDGLGQTLAFLLAKGKGSTNAHQFAYDHLSKWVTEQLGAPSQDLLPFILEVDTATYRRATTEALAYLHWIKRFAEAKGGKSEEESKEG
jgi:CRISPR-associated protein Cmr5